MAQMALGLGSNVGARREHLESAIAELASCGRITAVSPLYETAPIGMVDQAPFLNAVAVVAVEREPRDLLATLQAIERAHGRKRGKRWGPRSLDLDILLFENCQIDESGLTIPHPRMTERRFVLQPLLDVWPDATLPDGTLVAGLLSLVADQHLTIVATDWLEAPG